MHGKTEPRLVARLVSRSYGLLRAREDVAPRCLDVLCVSVRACVFACVWTCVLTCALGAVFLTVVAVVDFLTVLVRPAVEP